MPLQVVRCEKSHAHHHRQRTARRRPDRPALVMTPMRGGRVFCGRQHADDASPPMNNDASGANGGLANADPPAECLRPRQRAYLNHRRACAHPLGGRVPPAGQTGTSCLRGSMASDLHREVRSDPWLPVVSGRCGERWWRRKARANLPLTGTHDQAFLTLSHVCVKAGRTCRAGGGIEFGVANSCTRASRAMAATACRGWTNTRVRPAALRGSRCFNRSELARLLCPHPLGSPDADLVQGHETGLGQVDRSVPSSCVCPEP